MLWCSTQKSVLRILSLKTWGIGESANVNCQPSMNASLLISCVLTFKCCNTLNPDPMITKMVKIKRQKLSELDKELQPGAIIFTIYF